MKDVRTIQRQKLTCENITTLGSNVRRLLQFDRNCSAGRVGPRYGSSLTSDDIQSGLASRNVDVVVASQDKGGVESQSSQGRPGAHCDYLQGSGFGDNNKLGFRCLVCRIEEASAVCIVIDKTKVAVQARKQMWWYCKKYEVVAEGDDSDQKECRVATSVISRLDGRNR